ncbi:MAG TPA: DinB family protein [Thermomicrobiaceae bacterium]|nr:DinB family protein [Thermomicrobiaceae bacterium]
MNAEPRNFASPEAAAFWDSIAGTLDSLVGTLEGLSDEQLNWRPPAPDTNSLSVLVTHTLGNVRESLLEIFGGQQVHRDRDSEFRVTGNSAQDLQQRWQQLRPRAEAVLAALTPDELHRTYSHPRRGQIGGYDVLLLVATHAAQHLGHAELTRDLLRAQS